jgi:hypothetical protein
MAHAVKRKIREFINQTSSEKHSSIYKFLLLVTVAALFRAHQQQL